MTEELDVLIVGAGISGLTAGYTLKKNHPAIRFKILEASNRVGGWVRTTHESKYLIERGPESFITDKPWALELAKELGLADELIQTKKQPVGAYILRNKKLHPIPAGFSLISPTQIWPFIKSPILSPKGKFRALLEPFVPAQNHVSDESLADFVTRRFGKELLSAFAQPLASGIYGADPKKLSMKAALPRFWEAEQNHGSLILGLRYPQKAKAADQQAGGARYSLFVSFKQGIQTLTNALEEKISQNIVLNQRVETLENDRQHWHIKSKNHHWKAKSLVLALPAKVSQQLLKPTSKKLSQHLKQIPFGSSGTVTLAVDQNTFSKPLNAYGFVVPKVENRKIMACTFSSEKWEGRAPNNKTLLRAFISDPAVLELDDDDLAKTALCELQQILGFNAPPELTWIDRFKSAMPQYHVGHLELIQSIDKELEHLPNLYLTGNSYKGVGLPDTIHQAQLIANKILTEQKK